MKFSLAQSFFRKYNAHNRIPNGIIEKNFIDFFGNFSVESDYEPFFVYFQNSPFAGVDIINIDWCTKDDTFFVSIYDDRICLIKNDIQVSSVNVTSGRLVIVEDYAKGWTE
jgi:hypothetical protein